MRRLAQVIGAALVSLLMAQGAHADLASGWDKYTRGDYRAAETDLRAVRGNQSEAARLLIARIMARTGRYQEAEKQVRALVPSGDTGTNAEARIYLAELLRMTGRLTEARRILEPLVQSQPDRMRARYVLALVYRDLGDVREGQVWQGIEDELDPGKINVDEIAPSTLLYLAEAARYTGEFQLANDVFREIIDREPTLHDANIEWGHLFLDKYAPADAAESFDEVLKVDKNHPDAHAGLAAVKLETSYDLQAVTLHLGRALAINPKHIPSLLLRAGIEIDQNRWDKAKATLAEVLAVNPGHLDAHSRLATIHWLRDDTAAYQAEKKKVFALNPNYARFFHVIARSAVREHRYKEAIELEREAVAVTPTYYEAMEAIGTGYLRLGDEKQGLEWLRRAWKGDAYNLRTKNTLDLFEDWIPREYSFATSKHFKIRYHNREKAVMRRYIEPLLEDAYADMVARYRFTPKAPIVIELFQNADHYSVRTIGLPNLSALGVCFGQVITAMSPSVGDINWAMVLWHELSHVFAIQLSNSRVPRWYTEGLSEYETVLARPEWRRENDADVWAALMDNKLPAIDQLNEGFMKPNLREVTVAYHMSSLAMEYLAKTYGFDRIVEGLKLFGQGLETREVLEKISGKAVAVVDGEFRTWLLVRLRPYDGTFHVPGDLPPLAKLTQAAKAAPKDPDAQAKLALGHFYEGQAKPALAAADKALLLSPDQPLATYVKAELVMRDGDLNAAKQLYVNLVETGHDSFDVRARLAQIAVDQREFDLAIRHLCTAKALDPERSYPYQALAEIYNTQGKADAALAELERYVMIEQMQSEPLRELVAGLVKAGRWDKVRTYGELLTEITLTDAELFVTLGQAYLETGAPSQALASYDAALLVTPVMRRPAVAHIGRARALHKLGDRRGAKRALDQALKTEPENGDALLLRKQLVSR